MPEATYRQPGLLIDYTPLAAVVAGQVLQLPDGRAAFAPTAIAAGALGAVQVEGVCTLTKTTSMVVLQGSRIFWDHSANAAHLLHRNDKDFFVGTALEDATSAGTTVKVALNVKPVFTVGLDSGWVGVQVQTAGFVAAAGSGEGVNLRFSATAEAQKVDALSHRGMAVAEIGVVHALICVNDGGDAAALDCNIGLANGTHATDADAITESLFCHLDGNSVNINLESDDGTTEVAATDTTVDYTAGTPFLVQFDLRDLTDIQAYIDGVNVLPSSVFKLNAATGPLKFLAHLEKTSDDTPGNVTVLYGGVTQFEALNS
jgi:predicted RecA/RadA family phage recombinase